MKSFGLAALLVGGLAICGVPARPQERGRITPMKNVPWNTRSAATEKDNTDLEGSLGSTGNTHRTGSLRVRGGRITPMPNAPWNTTSAGVEKDSRAVEGQAGSNGTDVHSPVVSEPPEGGVMGFPNMQIFMPVQPIPSQQSYMHRSPSSKRMSQHTSRSASHRSRHHRHHHPTRRHHK